MRVARDTKTLDSFETAFREPDVTEPVSRRAASASTDTLNWPSPVTPRGIARVPTHTVGRVSERRAYVRARLSLPLSVQRVAGQRDTEQGLLRTQDISSSGVFFLSPRRIDPGTPIEIEVLLVDRPFGRGAVRMCATAHVVRAEDAEKSGWHGLAAAFDDISFRRDESLSH